MMSRAKSRAAISVFLFVFLIAVPAHAENLKIICSMFPQYDFAKNIAGDKAEVELLIKPGLDPHDFEPSPLDVKNLSDADIFIYTGVLMEPWTERILNVINNKTLVIDASHGVNLINNDPHIWLNLLNAVSMINNILEGMCRKDLLNAEFYKSSAERYIKMLTGLDDEFKEAVKNAKNDTLVFGGAFACSYFFDKYKLKYVSAYDGENEPGMARILDVIKYINKNKIKYIFYDELEPAEIAKSIAEQTGAELIIFYSLHGVTDKDFNDGVKFYDLMRRNLDNIRLALN